MADWKVFKGIVEKYTHDNAESLEIIRVGDYQLVAQKGNYQDGDTVIIIPDKSVLKNGTMLNEFGKYLTGPSKNRVKSISLRGEVSQGITWPLSELENSHGSRTADLIAAAELGEDISELMEVTKYEPPIPSALAGQVHGIRLTGIKGQIVSPNIYRHDCYQYGAFSKNFTPDEEVIITEKIHGSQINYVTTYDSTGNLEMELVTSKGLLGKGLEIKEDETNTYWKAVRNDKSKEVSAAIWKSAVEKGIIVPQDDKVNSIHFVGECVPVQAGYTYGTTGDKPKLLMYDVVIDGKHYGLDTFPELKQYWVPIVYQGKLSDTNVYDLSKGKESYSGKGLHIREGVVVQPKTLRKDNKNSVLLKLKVINPAYAKKESGEEIG